MLTTSHAQLTHPDTWQTTPVLCRADLDAPVWAVWHPHRAAWVPVPSAWLVLCGRLDRLDDNAAPPPVPTYTAWVGGTPLMTGIAPEDAQPLAALVADETLTLDTAPAEAVAA